MRIMNQKELQELKNTVAKMSGSVVAEDTRNHEIFDLHDIASRDEAMNRMMGDSGENMEIFTSKREDEAAMMGFLYWLDQEQEQQYAA